MTQVIRTALRVEGIVQGVGFRPFVYSLATGLGLGGLVGNDVDGVFAEIEGPPAAVGEFLRRLEREAPPLARIERVTTSAMPPAGTASFTIAPSGPDGRRRTLVAADTATCADCLRELSDPADRRYRYPFVNCVNCGPRFTIVRDVPYDRPLTTMAGFAMCEPCAAEYHDPADRRYHAQPVCCPACGPRLALLGPAGEPPDTGDPLDGAAALLRDGRILAVKGLGGYHLAADATHDDAVAALRARKHREDKPFAVLAASVAAARALCEVDDAAEALLTSRARPIVLLPRLPRAAVAPAAAPGNRHLGIMLPYTPLHHLLARAVAGPIVLTSGNVSDEPIAYRDEDALARLSGIADAFLTHDRAIHIRTDDSVTRVFRGRPLPVRRSRGHVPEPVVVPGGFPRQVLACGAELKNTFCLAKERHAFVSHHIGDLENVETLRSFTEGIEHFRRLFDVDPRVVAYDLHPEYLSTKYALDLTDVELVGVQHHHAHVASCLADNGWPAGSGRVIGVAFDGTGYGTDGTLWGGEFLIADYAGFERAGHLAPVPLPGGQAAIRQPWRMAAAYLDAAGLDAENLDVIRRNSARWPAIVAMARKGVNAPLTSSAGRLFDAVAALLGVRDAINYEGQAAIELEQLADPEEQGAYEAAIDAGDARKAFQVHGADLVRAAARDLAAGVPPAVIAARFHNGVAAAIEAACLLLRERHALTTVALSGGVFQNMLLLNQVVTRLESSGFTALTHSRVPCNDGGISLGQAVIAAASDIRVPELKLLLLLVRMFIAKCENMQVSGVIVRYAAALSAGAIAWPRVSVKTGGGGPMATFATGMQRVEESREKGLKTGALGLVSSVVIGVASTAPAYSLAATLFFVVAAVGLKSPLVAVLAFIPMLLCSIGFSELNKADPDCGTTFIWSTRAFGPAIGWAGGWATVAADILVMGSLAQVAGQYGFFLFQGPNSSIGANASGGWVLLVGVLWIVAMTYICYRGIELSARFQRVLLTIEVVMLMVLSVTALVKVFVSNPAGSVRPGLSWLSPSGLTLSAFVSGIILMLFIYWGWDTALSVNEETADKSRTPGRAGIISTVLLLFTYGIVIVAVQSFAGVGDKGVGLSNPDHQFDVLSATGSAIFGTSGLGPVLSRLLILMVLSSAAASTQTTILPAARSTLSMAAYRALPQQFAKISPRYLTPTVSTIVVGVASVALYIPLNFIAGGNPIADAVSAIGLYIAFYYGLTAFACAWYYRSTVADSARDLWMRGILPVLGGLVMFAAGFYSLQSDWVATNSYTSWTVPGLQWQIGGIFVIAALASLFGVASFVYMRVTAPAFFRRQTLTRSTPVRIPEMEL